MAAHRHAVATKRIFRIFFHRSAAAIGRGDGAFYVAASEFSRLARVPFTLTRPISDRFCFDVPYSGIFLFDVPYSGRLSFAPYSGRFCFCVPCAGVF